MINDLSLNTIIVSGTIAFVGWFLKQALSALIKLLIEAIKNLISKLNQTIGRVEILDAKMEKLTEAVGDHEKLRRDIKVYFDELKLVKKDVDQLKNQ